MSDNWVDELVEACWDEDRKVHAAGVLLLAALRVGPHIRPLKEATGIPWSLVQSTSYYLRQGKVWGRFDLHYPWLESLMNNEEGGWIEFTIDAMVGAGYVSYQSGGDGRKVSLRQVGEGILQEPSGMDSITWLRQHERFIGQRQWPPAT